MAENYGPFDGPDTVWSQGQWYDFAPTWAPSGVIGTPAASYNVGELALAVNGLSLTLGTGRAWVRGAGYKNDAGKAFAVTANANASLARRDRIVLRRDGDAKTVTAIRLEGTPASTPQAPALQQNEAGQWDVPLFSFLVPANSGTTLTGFIDERRFYDGSGRIVVTSMSTRPTTGLVVGDRIVALNRPTVTYAYDGAKWVQEGLLADFVGVPDGAYVSEQTASRAFQTSNSAGGFVVTMPYPFSAAPLWAYFLQGDSNAGNPLFFTPVPGNHTASQLSGTVRNPDNSSPATGSAFRVTLIAVGYNT